MPLGCLGPTEQKVATGEYKWFPPFGAIRRAAICGYASYNLYPSTHVPIYNHFEDTPIIRDINLSFRFFYQSYNPY